MIRIATATLLLSLLLLTPWSAGADEKPAHFDGWGAEQVAAHRKAQTVRVEARARAYFEGKKRLVGECRLCVGSGMRLPGNGRTSEACLFCGGTGFAPELSLEPTDLDRLYLHHGDQECRRRHLRILRELAGAVKEGRLHESPLAMASYRILDTKVLGECAAVVAETESLTKHYPEEVPAKKRIEVVRFLLSDGEWWALEDATGPAWTGAARYPEAHRERPTHDPEALTLYEAAYAKIPHLTIPEGMRLTFRAEALTPWSKRKARLVCSVRPPAPPEVEVERMPKDLQAEFEPAIAGSVQGLIRAHFEQSLLTDPAEVHLLSKPGAPRTVLFRGFSIDRLGQDGELTFGEDGLPLRLISKDGEFTVDWERKGDCSVPAKLEQVVADGETGITVELRYQPFEGLLLPYLIEMRGEFGEFELRMRGFALKPAD